MKRRDFIAFTLTAGAGICGGCLFGCVTKAAASNCVTSDDILGPYYRRNAPIRSDLTFPNVTGTRLQITGLVRTSDCNTPLPDATLDVWHCSSDGQYDNPSNAYLYRGAFRANPNGIYDLRTIVPGRYLNGDSYRPAHIHFKVSAPAHNELITQLYFSGDPYIETDPFSSQAKARARILTIEDVPGGEKRVLFDIVLART